MSAGQQNANFSVAYSRRGFWRGLLHEAFVVSGLLKGGQACRLSDLASLPDEELARVRPAVHRACDIFVDGDQVWSHCRETGDRVCLFPTADTASSAALGMFDGHHTLGQVGKRLAQTLDWDEARAFAHARDLFLRLAERLICLPRDPAKLEE